MINTVKKYLQLLGLILRHGHLRPAEQDFNRSRREGLSNLMEFVPSRIPLNTRRNSSPLLLQLAYFKNVFRKSRGHLKAGDVSYVRIPKSASTSISMAVLQKKYPTLSHKNITEKQINFVADVNLNSDVNESTYFTAVRNPMARLVSVYRSFFEKNSPEYIYGEYLFGILPQQLSFSEFLNRVSRIPDALKDPHLKPQCCFLRYYHQQNISVKVFKIEESEKLEAFLQQNDLQLPHLNKSPETYDYKDYFDEKTLKLACEIYACDIELFSYEQEIQALKHA